MDSIFTLKANDGTARAGVLHTAHGDVPTPAFIPVASQGSVKALDPADLRAVGATIVLANTYHMYLRPGVETVSGLGGLHGFMSWSGPLLTDSGGFQGFSLEHLRELNEDGIVFKSHLDGSLHEFTPEAVVDYQRGLGADVIMPLDVCVSSDSDREDVEAAVARTGRWAERSLKAHASGGQSLFGIVQGGVFEDLRARSVSEITSMGFPGYAIGGLSVGESKAEMYGVAGSTALLLPEDRPRYLMGVGAPEDLVECVARGVDMFDCVLPTRIARSAALFVREGRVNVDTAPFRKRDAPVDPGCDCYTCTTHSAAYLNHLFRARELLAYRLATIHNLRFVLRLMEQMRASIVAGRFDSYRRDFHDRFVPPKAEVRRDQQRKWKQSRRRAHEDL
jgi:queuine tRNA-ribosyltransferase